MEEKSKEDLESILDKIQDLNSFLHEAGIDDAKELIKAAKRAIVKSFVETEINEYFKEE